MKLRVLVVEDETELRELICELLFANNIDTVQAAHGLDALRILKRNSFFDLILMDWNMPQMDGKQFLIELPALYEQQKRKSIPIIVLSANQPVLPEGCHYIEKPFDVHLLVREVLKIIA